MQLAQAASHHLAARRSLGDGLLQDVLADGRRFRTLNVLDTATRECLAIEVDTALPGQRVVRLLDHLICWHSAPRQITLDNGPEFTGQVLDAWAYHHRVILDFIDPGTPHKPMQNGYRESFHGNSTADA